MIFKKHKYCHYCGAHMRDIEQTYSIGFSRTTGERRYKTKTFRACEAGVADFILRENHDGWGRYDPVGSLKIVS